MLRILTLAAGLSGAAGLSQFPEFSQQYLQRLSGAVDELRGMAVAFDVTAKMRGLSREEALAQLEGTAFKEDLRDTMGATLARYDRLQADYDTMKAQSVVQRLSTPWNFADSELARRTWDTFKPALPLTVDGAICAAVGFVSGWAIMAAFLSLLLWPVRRLLAA